jgi:hypothetical protein
MAALICCLPRPVSESAFHPPYLNASFNVPWLAWERFFCPAGRLGYRLVLPLAADPAGVRQKDEGRGKACWLAFPGYPFEGKHLWVCACYLRRLSSRLAD